ncbi:MAG: hypothetical protein LIP28_02545, partial [Deltaproteobacteria bacterium]|nr:hypothetical protein [Deltaproteobacteria bacterium]
VTYKAAGVGSAINEIRADEHSPITVTITAKSGNAAAKSYAMYAEGIAAENRITGGSENDLVVVNGNIDVAKGGKNSIHTGAGDDHIRLNGAVGSGALDVQGGDGYDVLVLMASSVSEFNARYKAWLTGLTPEQMAGFGIESIRVSGGMDNDDDISWLHDWINDYNAAYGSNGTISQGEDIGFAWDQALTGDDLMAYDNVPADDTGYHIDVTGDHLAQHADQFGGLTLGGGDDWLLVDGDLTTTVDTGAGHDNLHVSGDLASLVDMGAGNDYLRVEGNLAGGRVYMGDGNDKATIMGDVSGSTIDMGDGDDYLHIFGNVTNSALIGGKGEHDVLHLSLDADGLTNILSDGTVLITGFEDLIMDMTNGSADDLNLDELLGGLSASGVDNVYIRGDQNDSVSLSDNGWTQQGATYTDADGITYDIYQKSGDEMTLYVQQEISAITGG